MSDFVFSSICSISFFSYLLSSWCLLLWFFSFYFLFFYIKPLQKKSSLNEQSENKTLSATRWKSGTCGYSIQRSALNHTWNGQEVIHGGDVIHGLGQDAHLLLPLILENVHVVLGHLALGAGSQSESSVDNLSWKNGREWYTRYVNNDILYYVLCLPLIPCHSFLLKL